MKNAFLSKIAAAIVPKKKSAHATKKRGPQVTGRISETEDFLRKVALRCRRRCEAHCLVSPRAEDLRAIAALEELAARAEALASSLRQPELPFSS